jgi:rhamnulokinase
MSDARHYIAVDLGAESGRVMLVDVTAETLSLQEVRRFPNGPRDLDGALHWDYERLIREIKAGIREAAALQPRVQSIGVDTWGVDFGLIDKNGRLIEAPYHYRNSRAEVMDRAFETMDQKQIYANTGIQFMPINSLYQLLAIKEQRPELLAQADKLLFMANLIMYELTGDISADYTLASTSQMLDMNTGQWSESLLDAFGLPRSILPAIKMPGEAAGTLKPELAQELGCPEIPVVSVGTHDTASAVAAVPVTHDRNWAYLSSGTWSLMGIETPTPVINETTCALSCTNEGGVCNTIRLLTNIMGLWLVQECKRHWAENGEDLNYTRITEMATGAKPFQGVLDTNYHEFLAPGDMPAKINRHLAATGQHTVSDKGQIVRLVLESLALRYDTVIRNLESLAQPIEVLHIVGGGTQNGLLNQLTANAIGKTVITGPIEATVMGNVLIQALAAGQIDSLKAGRQRVAASFDTQTYTPQGEDAWAEFKQKAQAVLG